MSQQRTQLQQQIESGQPVLIAELVPPRGGDADTVRCAARRYAGEVHGLGVSDNRDGIRMSALVAAAIVAAEGIEPILHVVTRDRNRVALLSDALGAHALGVRNVLCTTGTHQTLGVCRNARNVFDVDSIQLLQMYTALGSNGSTIAGQQFDAAGPLFVGATASPFADPLELQVMRLAKKVAAGARFLITQPVFDIERLEAWWAEVTRRGLHEKVAFIVGVKPLADAEAARVYATSHPRPMVPEGLIERLSSKSDQSAQRAVGIEIACETIERLSKVRGLRGFDIRGDGDDDLALELIDKSGLRCR